MISRLFRSAIFVACLSTAGHAAPVGFLEICKDSAPAGALSGFFNFTIAGQAGTFSVPVGACTNAIPLNSGPVFITEVPRAGSILLSINTFPANRLDSFNLLTGVAQVEIVTGDISAQTVVTFTNGITPEPGTMWLMGIGLAFAAFFRWAKRPAARPGAAPIQSSAG